MGGRWLAANYRPERALRCSASLSQQNRRPLVIEETGANARGGTCRAIARGETHNLSLPTFLWMSPSPPNGSSHKPRRRQPKKLTPSSDETQHMLSPSHAHATSLQSIEILPRTPKTPGAVRRGHGRPSDDVDNVELSLLSESDRRAAAEDLSLDEEQEYLAQAEASKSVSSRDRQAMVLLTILCASSLPCRNSL